MTSINLALSQCRVYVQRDIILYIICLVFLFDSICFHRMISMYTDIIMLNLTKSISFSTGLSTGFNNTITPPPIVGIDILMIYTISQMCTLFVKCF